MIEIGEVMNMANIKYAELRGDELERPSAEIEPIRSCQVKALAIALVDIFNEELEILQRDISETYGLGSRVKRLEDESTS